MRDVRTLPFRYIHFRLCYFYRELITKFHVSHKQLMDFLNQDQVESKNYPNEPLARRLEL